MGLTQAVAWAMGDTRRKASCDHSLNEWLKQRLYALALGQELKRYSLYFELITVWPGLSRLIVLWPVWTPR